MRRDFACAGLLLLLLLPGVIGCQMKATGIQKNTLVAAKETGGEQLNRNDGLTPAALKSLDDRIAYSAGLDAGTDLQKVDLNINSIHHLLQGIKDSLLGNEPLLTVEEQQQVRSMFLAERASKRSKELGSQSEKNLAEGNRFLQENAKKEGVKTLASGLQYRVLKEGNGATPRRNQQVKIRYVVRSIDGAEIDGTHKENPATLAVEGVLAAWSEALQLMKVGDKWELFAPAILAYGEKGVGEVIRPFQAVVFEIELLAVQ